MSLGGGFRTRVDRRITGPKLISFAGVQSNSFVSDSTGFETSGISIGLSWTTGSATGLSILETYDAEHYLIKA